LPHPQKTIAFSNYTSAPRNDRPPTSPKAIAYSLKSNSDLLNYGYFILILISYNIIDNFAKGVKSMTSREQLIQELIEVPDELVKVVLDFLHRVKTTRNHHPLARFAGILSDAEAVDLQNVIRSDCRQVDINEW
jgi:hypothetical protein